MVMKTAFCLITYLFRSSFYRTIVLWCCVSSSVPIKISPCAIWNTTGVTIAGTGVPGNSARQLSFPQNIFIRDKTKRLYVSDTFNNRIKTFPLDRSTTTGTTLFSQLSHG
ncbi:unnamed protein product [Rotaria socialis]|uniref:NHL repeat-containing protein n=1 Tax=Rotaria socialis TaxID=392032 RepID=A0A821FPX4_9BILA|nr:unnamed protein product [Rotaria socialis]